MFYFETIQELAAMEKHGPYVWACVFITLVLLCALSIWPVIKRKRWLKHMIRQQQRQELLAKRSKVNAP